MPWKINVVYFTVLCQLALNLSSFSIIFNSLCVLSVLQVGKKLISSVDNWILHEIKIAAILWEVIVIILLILL